MRDIEVETMTDQQELQLTDHPPLPWCRPSNVAELREAFARREKGEVCECGECWDARLEMPADVTSIIYRYAQNQVRDTDENVIPCANIFLLDSFRWEMDVCDDNGMWFRLRRK